MLTDSGGYQIFSMGHGSVSDEVKGRRHAGNTPGGTSPSSGKSLLKIDESGATFRSYIDGSVHSLSPESSIQVQYKLGADLVVVLDECTPFHAHRSYTAASMRRSHRWALRSLREFRRLGCAAPRPVGGSDGGSGTPQALYGIVQGGVFEDLREESASFVNQYPFFGAAIGGSLGPDKACMHGVVALTRPLLREDRPVHLLGIGGVRDVFHGVRLGVDTFDCVHPTRLGRHGGALVLAAHWDRLREEVEARDRLEEAEAEQAGAEAQAAALASAPAAGSHGTGESISGSEQPGGKTRKLTHQERKQQNWQRKLLKQHKLQRKNELVVREHINVTKPAMAGDPRPLDPDCACSTCRHFSRGYLHHLLRAKEQLGQTLLTAHNVHFMNTLMSDIRAGIEGGCLDEVERRYVHPELLLTPPGSAPAPAP
jgi:queuine tRNA-ribosyltransferase